jgi:hypothetical protein
LVPPSSVRHNPPSLPTQNRLAFVREYRTTWMSWCTFCPLPQPVMSGLSVVPPSVERAKRIVPTRIVLELVGCTSSVRLYVHCPSQAFVFRRLQLVAPFVVRYSAELEPRA